MNRSHRLYATRMNSLYVSAALTVFVGVAYGVPQDEQRAPILRYAEDTTDAGITTDHESAWERRAGAQLLSEVGGSGGDNCNTAPVTLISAGPPGSPNTVTLNGDLSLATAGDCFGSSTRWWEAFQLNTCADVILDFCSTSPDLSPNFSSLWTVCAPDGSSCGSFIGSNGFSRDLCGGGENNISIFFDALAPGTYYYPIIVPDPPISYVMHITAEECSGACTGCLGSCCDTITETCTDDLNLEQCSGAQETWTARSKCCATECRDPAGPEFDSSGIDLLSRVSLEDFAAFNGTPGDPHTGNEVWGYTSPSGREYALMGTTTGTGFVDLTDPANPVIVAFINNGGVDTAWRDMAIFGEHAYVVTDFGGIGLQILDLSDIDNGNVTFVKTTDLGVGFTEAHNVYVNSASGFLYLCIPDIGDGHGLTVVSLADPVNPTIAGTWTENTHCHDVQVISYTSGPNAGKEIAFCFAEGDGLKIADVTNKASMTTLSTFDYGPVTYCHQGWVSKDGRYVFIGDELDERDNVLVDRTTTYVADVLDLENPTLASTFEFDSCNIDHNLMVRGDYVYEANYATGLRVLDFTSPPNLTDFAHFDTRPEDNGTNFQGAWGVFSDFPSGIVVLSDRQRGLFVFDNPEPPPPPPPPIPVASTWGLSVMVLLMLAGGTVVVRRAVLLRSVG